MKKDYFVFTILSLFLSFSATAQNHLQVEWAKQFGGNNSYTTGFSIEVDVLGNVYAMGYFEGTSDFDPSSNLYTLTSEQQENAFICKLDASGNFLWAKRIVESLDYNYGGSDFDIDSSGNIYYIGVFEGLTDFDPGPGTYNLNSVSPGDVFITKLDALGNFVWAKQFEGPEEDRTFSIKVSSAGEIYILGGFGGTVDFDPGPNVYNLVSAGSDDIFICKLDASGNFLWAKQFVGNAINSGRSITIDALGNIYCTGHFTGTVDFDPGTGTYNLSSSGLTEADIFICKLDSLGNFVWAKQQDGGTGYIDSSIDLFVDNLQNVYTTGHFFDTVDFDTGASTYILTSSGVRDAFVSKLDSSGNFLWAKGFGGTGDDSGTSISLDSSGNIFVTGIFENTVDFDPGTGSHTLTSAGGNDNFISKFDNSGDFLSVYRIGGAGFNEMFSMVHGNNIYLVGAFQNTSDFDFGSNSFNMTSQGIIDAFVLKLSDNLGIVENLIEQNIQSYPNPVPDKLNISAKMEIDQVQGYDLLGRKVLEEKPGALNTILNLEKLKSGMYIVEITTEGKTLSYKIVKE